MIKCKVDSCNDPVKHKGLCGKHYKRQWRHGSPLITKIDMEPKTEKCCVEGCVEISRYPRTKMCKIHHLRFRRYGRTHSIKRPYGSGKIDRAGYKVISVNGKQIYEHIFMAQCMTGGPLPKGSIVHHKDRNKQNNSPENLHIFDSQSEHMYQHWLEDNYEHEERLAIMEFGG